MGSPPKGCRSSCLLPRADHGAEIVLNNSFFKKKKLQRDNEKYLALLNVSEGYIKDANTPTSPAFLINIR